MKTFIFTLRGTDITVSIPAENGLKAWAKLGKITNNASFIKFDLQEELGSVKP